MRLSQKKRRSSLTGPIARCSHRIRYGRCCSLLSRCYSLHTMLLPIIISHLRQSISCASLPQRAVLFRDDGTSAEVRTYLLIFLRSLKLAVISTAICLLLGYPIAYIMAHAKEKTQKTMMTLIMIPMWMNFLIRTYAWMTILQDAGIVNGLLDKLGIAPIHVIGTETAVIIGMVYDYFPYMILPIYSILVKLDGRLVEAARDLGCNGFSVLRRVVLPLSMPGIISGITMVLIPSISTFYISQKLGSGKFFLIGDAIEGQYVANNLHFAAAIAFVLMLILLAGMAIMKYCTSRFVYGGD